MQKVTLIAGLPGCGKTTYLEGLPGFDPHTHFDDYHSRACGDSEDFKKSKDYECLKKSMKQGKDCFIGDVEYCRGERRVEAETGVKELAKELDIKVTIEWIYFENNSDVCKGRVLERGQRESRDSEKESKKIDELSPIYEIPDGATIIPVVAD